MDPMTVTHSLCEPAVEMHMNMSQDRIYRENAGKQMEHLDQAPALTPTVTTPQCGHIVWEKIHGTANENHTFNQPNLAA